jgi:hypothetical protein
MSETNNTEKTQSELIQNFTTFCIIVLVIVVILIIAL